jgi:hypothetical protein
VLREQQVMIEILRPPVPPPVVQPEPPKPEPPPPIARKTEAHRPEPRVVAKLEPVTQPTKVSPANELPELPVGDEPALAMASGKGTGTVAAPPPPATRRQHPCAWRLRPRWPRTKGRTISRTHGPPTRSWRSGGDGKVKCCFACACRRRGARHHLGSKVEWSRPAGYGSRRGCAWLVVRTRTPWQPGRRRVGDRAHRLSFAIEGASSSCPTRLRRSLFREHLDCCCLPPC